MRKRHTVGHGLLAALAAGAAVAALAVPAVAQGLPGVASDGKAPGQRAPYRGPSQYQPMSDEVLKALGATQQAEKRAETLYEKGDYRAAEVECRKALRLSPAIQSSRESPPRVFNLFALELLGHILLAQDRAPEALQAYLACYPNMSSYDLDLGTTIAYCRVGDYQNALRYYTKTMQGGGIADRLTDPDMPSLQGLAGVMAGALMSRGARRVAMLGDTTSGLADLFDAEKLAPQSARVARVTADVLRGCGRLSECLVRLRRAARYGHGELAKDSDDRAYSIAMQIRLHPEVDRSPAAARTSPQR